MVQGRCEEEVFAFGFVSAECRSGYWEIHSIGHVSSPPDAEEKSQKSGPSTKALAETDIAAVLAKGSGTREKLLDCNACGTVAALVFSCRQGTNEHCLESRRSRQVNAGARVFQLADSFFQVESHETPVSNNGIGLGGSPGKSTEV